ncbi:CPCC family cysteine-rich protein [Thiosocius teredinicola]|uniref:CPCC family cysteine-rich protein n=1 Tax=Thiosocius teredinicola TaxID=1973002 RepID=UPI00099143EF
METCACCGYATIDQKGNYEICPICYWENDPVQEADPWFQGGANTPSLFEAQSNFKAFGAMEKRFVSDTRPPSSADRKNPKWRELVEKDREFCTTPVEIERARRTERSSSYNYWERNA